MWRVLARFFDPYKGFSVRMQADGRFVGGFTSVAGLADVAGTARGKTREGIGAFGVPQEAPQAQTVRPSGDHAPITFKRGLIDSAFLFAWTRSTSESMSAARQDILVELRDDAGQTTLKFMARQCVPVKFTGPTLNAKGSGAVAIEELLLDAEGYEVIV